MNRYRGLMLVFFACWMMHSGRGQALQAAAQPTPVADTANASFPLADDEKNPVIIADIFIIGNKKTKPYIIEREIPFKIGQHLMKSQLPEKMELARQQLMNTTLFNEVQVTLDRQMEDLVIIKVVVKERWYFFPLPYFKLVDRNFNQWWVEHNRSLDRVNYGLKLMHNNFSGRNDKLQLNLITGYSRQAVFRYSQPAADKSLRFGFNVGFSYAENKEIIYNTDSNKQRFFKPEDRFVSKTFQGHLAFTYRPKVRTTHALRFAYANMVVDTAVLRLNPLFFPDRQTQLRYPEISYSISHYNVDYIPYPTKGVTFVGTILKRGFDRSINMWQLGATASYTLPVFPKSQLYFQATGAVKLPFRQTFHNQRLFGYGDLYMRGLEYYVADGVAGFVARMTARREVLNFSIKPPVILGAHDKIPFRVLLKAYGDLGYVYDKYPTSYSTLSNKWLRTYGIGIDIITFYDFVIRLEYSFNQLNEQGLFLHSRSDF